MTEPDFITYYDNDKLFLYSYTLNDSKELTVKLLKDMKIISAGFKHIGFGVINFIINDSKMPILVPDFVVGIFNNLINEIEKFNGFFLNVVLNEINLRGKKIEILTSSNVNQQSFEYLYRNNPKYGITLQFDIKHFGVINKSGIIGFSLNYPKEVDSLSNGQGELLSQIKRFVYELYNNDNIEYVKNIKRTDKKEKSTIEKFETIPKHIKGVFDNYQKELNRLNDYKKALDCVSIKVFEDEQRQSYRGATLKNVKDKIRSDFQKYNLIPKQ